MTASRIRIVVGACGHPHSDAALRYAADQATRRAGEVLAVHVRRRWSPPLLSQYDLSSLALQVSDAWEELAFDQVRSALGDGTAAWRYTTGQGDVAGCLAAVARHVGAAAIVIGGRRTGLLARTFSRSVARCLSGSAIPVVAVSAPERPTGSPTSSGTAPSASS